MKSSKRYLITIPAGLVKDGVGKLLDGLAWTSGFYVLHSDAFKPLSGEAHYHIYLTFLKSVDFFVVRDYFDHFKVYVDIPKMKYFVLEAYLSHKGKYRICSLIEEK